MQFLVGLNDTYDSIRDQILVLDALPTVHKAYSMALSVEKQQEVHINFGTPTKISAMFARSSHNNSYVKKKSQFRGKQDSKNKIGGDRYCDFCKVNGHIKKSCFKLNDYPDWYKELKEKKKNLINSAHMAHIDSNKLEESPLRDFIDQDANMESMNTLLQQFNQFIKANHKVETHFANLSHIIDFVGMNVYLLNSLRSNQFDKDTWILDT